MNTSVTPPLSTSPLARLFFNVPIFGWIARDIARDSETGQVNNIYFAIVAFVSLWGISFMTFGLPGLYVPAVAMVPIIFCMLIWISLGRIDNVVENSGHGSDH